MNHLLCFLWLAFKRQLPVKTPREMKFEDESRLRNLAIAYQHGDITESDYRAARARIHG